MPRRHRRICPRIIRPSRLRRQHRGANPRRTQILPRTRGVALQSRRHTRHVHTHIKSIHLQTTRRHKPVAAIIARATQNNAPMNACTRCNPCRTTRHRSACATHCRVRGQITLGKCDRLRISNTFHRDPLHVCLHQNQTKSNNAYHYITSEGHSSPCTLRPTLLLNKRNTPYHRFVTGRALGFDNRSGA